MKRVITLPIGLLQFLGFSITLLFVMSCSKLDQNADLNALIEFEQDDEDITGDNFIDILTNGDGESVSLYQASYPQEFQTNQTKKATFDNASEVAGSVAVLYYVETSNLSGHLSSSNPNQLTLDELLLFKPHETQILEGSNDPSYELFSSQEQEFQAFIIGSNGIEYFVSQVMTMSVIEPPSSGAPNVEFVNGKWMKLNGELFFPIYAWAQPPSSDLVAGGQVAAEYFKDLNFNTFMHNGKNNDALNDLWLSDLAANDMYGILKFDPNMIDRPNLIAWMTSDEPVANGISFEEYEEEFEEIEEGYEAIQSELNIPIATNFVPQTYEGFGYNPNQVDDGDIETYLQYTALPSIVSLDFYPVTGWNNRDWVKLNGHMIDGLLSDYLNHQKPGWMIVESANQHLYWTYECTPEPYETRLEVWDSIINGATGIGYFPLKLEPGGFAWVNHTEEMEEELRRTNRQITELTEVILSEDPGLLVNVTGANSADYSYTMRKQGSTYYLFAANKNVGLDPGGSHDVCITPENYSSIDLTFTFQKEIASIELYDDLSPDQPSVNGSSFSHHFDDLEVHIYVIEFEE